MLQNGGIKAYLHLYLPHRTWTWIHLDNCNCDQTQETARHSSTTRIGFQEPRECGALNSRTAQDGVGKQNGTESLRGEDSL